SRWLFASLFTSLALAVVSSQGCAATGATLGSSGSDSGFGISAGGAGGECVFCTGQTGGGLPIGTLLVTPATAELTVANGSIPTATFKAEIDGIDVSDKVKWIFEKPDVGSMQPGGVFLPTGNVGGTGKVLASFQDKEGEALATVTVVKTVNTAGVQPQQEMQFDAPSGPDPTLQIVYPFDKTVMPLRVLAPEIQWVGGAGGDIYRVRFTSKHITYTEFVTSPIPGVYTIDQQAWENIQFSGLGPLSDPLKFEIARLSGGVAYQAKLLELRIAQGIVYGSVYYWQLPDACGGDGNGKILRIKPSSTTPDEFFQPGECWGCHTVSRDGTRMMATFETGSANGFPLQTIKLDTTPSQFDTITQATGITGVYAAYNDDGTKILYSDNSSGTKPAGSAALHIINSANGAAVLSNAMPAGCGEPAWSPDGTMIAGICGLTDGGWTFDSSSGALIVNQLNLAQNQVMGSQMIVQQGGLPGRPAYPTFTPDSKHLAFGRPTSGSRTSGNGTLWMVENSGKNPVELKNASSDNQSFNPVFAPKSAGGYTWIVFISRRNYGHKLLGANRQQLWMTAIQDPPVPGADPSSPPFFVRGQALCGKSENAYYALDPCKKDGEECEHGIECCNKSCIWDDGQMTYICKPPDGGDCIPTGSGVCDDDFDCCDFSSGVVCINGFCEIKPPM
ncbi:MAG: hypothetical protein EXR75_15250, partial [Myxococcales bacterium]|nr:hypothetical protein [Myxococcales bacterium]